MIVPMNKAHWDVLNLTLPLALQEDTRGVVCVDDDTGEYGEAESDGKGNSTGYQTRARLYGTPSTGTARFGENAVNHTVTTDGKTIQEIYLEWQTLFGEGEVTDDGFVLPTRHGVVHGFDWEITDPDLGIEITQQLIPDAPAVSEWGVVGIALLVLVAGTIVLRRRRALRPATGE